MKTFNESDLITWSNRHEAKIGAKGYFGHSIAYLNANIKANHVYELINISDDFSDCFSCSISGDIRSYDFFLPIEAVKEEKKYRPLKNIKELCEFIFRMARNPELYSIKYKSEEQCIYELLSDGYIIHLRNKKTEKEYYSKIANIVKDEEDYILITCAGYSLLDLFNTFDIKIDGEWLPFGVQE